jgi:hypothetical protein
MVGLYGLMGNSTSVRGRIDADEIVHFEDIKRTRCADGRDIYSGKVWCERSVHMTVHESDDHFMNFCSVFYEYPVVISVFVDKVVETTNLTDLRHLKNVYGELYTKEDVWAVVTKRVDTAGTYHSPSHCMNEIYDNVTARPQGMSDHSQAAAISFVLLTLVMVQELDILPCARDIANRCAWHIVRYDRFCKFCSAVGWENNCSRCGKAYTVTRRTVKNISQYMDQFMINPTNNRQFASASSPAFAVLDQILDQRIRVTDISNIIREYSGIPRLRKKDIQLSEVQAQVKTMFDYQDFYI